MAWSPDGARLAAGGASLLVWDTESETSELWRAAQLNDGVATFVEDHLVACTPDAWEHLGYVVPDDEGVLQRWPIELGGPLPLYDTLIAG